MTRIDPCYTSGAGIVTRGIPVVNGTIICPACDTHLRVDDRICIPEHGKPMRATPAERMLARLRALGLTVPEGSTIERTYAGIHQRRDGAWSWYVREPRPRSTAVGSQYPLGTLLRGRITASQSWRDNDIHIDPADPRDTGGAAYRLYLVEPETTP